MSALGHGIKLDDDISLNTYFQSDSPMRKLYLQREDMDSPDSSETVAPSRNAPVMPCT